jgi:hypothetical protein
MVDAEGHQPPPCIVCGAPSDGVPADSTLAASGSTPIKFLCDHRIGVCEEHTAVGGNPGFLCTSCLTIVAYCDKWQCLLTAGLQKLHSAAGNRAKANGDDHGSPRAEASEV